MMHYELICFVINSFKYLLSLFVSQQPFHQKMDLGQISIIIPDKQSTLSTLSDVDTDETLSRYSSLKMANQHNQCLI